MKRKPKIAIGTCNRCGGNVYPDTIKGYVAYCPTCDESMYGFEITRFSEKEKTALKDLTSVKDVEKSLN